MGTVFLETECSSLLSLCCRRCDADGAVELFQRCAHCPSALHDTHCSSPLHHVPAFLVFQVPTLVSRHDFVKLACQTKIMPEREAVKGLLLEF